MVLFSSCVGGEFEVGMYPVHVGVYVGGCDVFWIVDDKYVIYVSGVEDDVFVVHDLFKVGFL